VTLETSMEERKVAEQKYTDAVAEGTKMAVLATYATTTSRSLVRVNIGNFPPKSKATITCFMHT